MHLFYLVLMNSFTREGAGDIDLGVRESPGPE